jgi:hypothetical protein
LLLAGTKTPTGNAFSPVLLNAAMTAPALLFGDDSDQSETQLNVRSISASSSSASLASQSKTAGSLHDERSISASNPRGSTLEDSW